MSIEKVRRWDIEREDYDMYTMSEQIDGRYIEYADVAGLVEALKQIAEWPDGGNRYGQTNIKNFARNELARWTP